MQRSHFITALLIAMLLSFTVISLPAKNANATEALIGQNIPHPLTLLDQNNQRQSFKSLSGEKGLVLIFVRSADWCPYCKVQLIDLKDNGKAITDLGYNIATISYDAPNILAAFANKYDFPYPMLSDEGSVAIRAFDILNTEYDSDQFAYGVPHPYVYVIGSDQIVQHVLHEESYKDRPQIEAITAAIKGK